MKAGSDELHFGYDASGRPMVIEYGDTKYLYLTNLQGDVIAITDRMGYEEVRYTYDAWGNILSIIGSMADTLGAVNPLRYRGYVYDTDTGLYYLQSRYYNPEWGRFINADGYTSTGQGILGNNMFAYCRNNPVARKDRSGTADMQIAEFSMEVDPDGKYDEVGVGNGGWGLGIHSSYYVTKSVQAYERNWRNSSYNQNYINYIEPSACFVAGTLVQHEDGTKPIEEIKVGDHVWAWDEETGEVALKEVVEIYINQSDELIHVFVNGEEIVTTPTHPFYSPVKGWTAAAKLRAGDILVLLNGEYVVVEKVQHEILEAPITVYNFQVEGYHTYYVSDAGVLVHNSCNQTFETENAAMRAAKRSVNIPMSAMPTFTGKLKMIGQDGIVYFAEYEVYVEKYIRNDFGGHLFRDGVTMARHYNSGIYLDNQFISSGEHFYY